MVNSYKISIREDKARDRREKIDIDSPAVQDICPKKAPAGPAEGERSFEKKGKGDGVPPRRASGLLGQFNQVVLRTEDATFIKAIARHTRTAHHGVSRLA